MNTQWATITAALGGGFIGAVATLCGSWIKGHYDIRAEQLQAASASSEASTERRRRAYAQLVASARAVLRNQRQLQHAYVLDRSADPEVRQISDHGSELIDTLTEAVALVEIVGSVTARTAAVVIFDSAKATGDIYAARSLDLVAAQKRRKPTLPAFDAAAVDTSTAELAGAIDDFINEVRRDLRGLPPLNFAVKLKDATARREHSS